MAGGGLQALRRRIRSTQNTQQITRAMKMVAGAKLRRAEARAKNAHDYFEAMREITARAVQGTSYPHPLLASRPEQTVAMVVITSDRGLAGPYNASVLRHAGLEMARFGPDNVRVVVVGRKGRDYFRFRGLTLLDQYVNLGDEPEYRQARAIADAITGHYLSTTVDAVYLTYMQYVNALSQVPRTIRLLPVEAPEQRSESGATPYVFEPEAEDVFEELLPRYLEVLVYGALLEAKASEQGARMTAMDSASKNAEELIKKMILQRNRLRQAEITREIAELVGGAEALT